MNGIYANIGGRLMVNVTIYSIHGSYGIYIYNIKISIGGIPNRRNVLFLQIFLKRAAKPSAGNTSANFP